MQSHNRHINSLMVGTSCGEVFAVPLDSGLGTGVKPSMHCAICNVILLIVSGHIITVDDNSAVLSLHFVLDNQVLQPPVTDTIRGVESQPAVIETSPVAVLTKQLRLCALMGELDSVAKDIKVGLLINAVICELI